MKEKSIQDSLVVCFSTASLKADIWTNKQHLMSRLSKKDGYDVIYIDQGMSTREIKKALIQKDWNYFLKPIWNYNRHLKSYSFYFLPLIKGGVLKKVSWRCLYNFIIKKIKTSDYKEIIFWVYQPEAFNFLEHLLRKQAKFKFLIIYDCVDDFKTQPFYLNHKKRQGELIRLENKLVTNADIVITTSEELYRDKVKLNIDTYYIHNVGDYHHFSRPNGVIPSELQYLVNLREKKILYAGVIDDYKIDLNLIDRVTDVIDAHFLFIGPIRVNEEIFLLEKLKKKNNVKFYGYITYNNLPAILHLADIIWLPYQSNDHTNYVFPLKLFEAFATGKQVIARDLNSYKKYKEYMQVFTNSEDAIVELQASISKELAIERKELAKKNSWESRLNKILEIIKKHNSQKQ